MRVTGKEAERQRYEMERSRCRLKGVPPRGGSGLLLGRKENQKEAVGTQRLATL